MIQAGSLLLFSLWFISLIFSTKNRGSGAFGRVILVKSRESEEYAAVKIMEKVNFLLQMKPIAIFDRGKVRKESEKLRKLEIRLLWMVELEKLHISTRKYSIARILSSHSRAAKEGNIVYRGNSQ